MTEEIKTDPQGQSTTTTVPAVGQDAGQTTTVQTTQDDLPEKFKGKTASDIAKSYIELESKLGKDGEEKKTLKKQLEDHQALAMVIKGNPELEKAVLAEIDRVSGKPAPSQDKTTTELTTPARQDDTRLAVEGDVISRFEDRFGINRLNPDTRKELYTKITSELGDMLDPLGTKTPREVLNAIPLNKLGKYLDKAYQLATLGDAKEQGRVKGLLEARQNSEAMFGSIPGTGATSSSRGLSAEEKKVAANMGISEEKYLANKVAMEEGK